MIGTDNSSPIGIMDTSINDPFANSINGMMQSQYPYSYTYNIESMMVIDDEKLNEKLSLSYKQIKKKHIYFIVNVIGKDVEPLEIILNYIRLNKKIDIKLIRNGYEMILKGFRFVKIKGLENSSSKDLIKVKFDYDKSIYNNILKTEEEKREEKITQLKDIIQNNDIQNK